MRKGTFIISLFNIELPRLKFTHKRTGATIYIYMYNCAAALYTRSSNGQNVNMPMAAPRLSA